MKKRITLYSLLILLLLFFVTGAATLLTETGLQFSTYIAGKFLPGQLDIGQISGRLVDHIQANNIHYKDKNLTISIKQTQIDWKFFQLFSKKIDVTQCHIQGVQITTKEAITKQEREVSTTEHSIANFISESSLPQINLPIEIILHDVAISQLTYNHHQEHPIDIESLKLNIHLQDDRLTIHDFSLKSKHYDMRLTGNILLNYPVETNLKATIIYHLNNDKPITSQLSITGNLKDKINFNMAIKDPFQTNIDATIQEAIKQGPIDAAGHWKKLRIPLNKSNTFKSEAGQFSITGTLKDYTLTADSDIQSSTIPKSHWHIQGQGNVDSIKLNTIKTKFIKGELTSQLQLTWYPYVTWKGTLQAKDFNPGLEWPKWKGDVNFVLNTNGKLNGQSTYYNILIDKVSGTVHQHPLKGHFKAHYASQEFNITQSSLTIGDDFLRISGKLGKVWDFNWSINAPNVAEAFIDASGSVIGKGHIKGPNKTPYIKGELDFKEFLFKRIYFKKLSTNFDIDFRPHGKSLMQLTGNELLLADYAINKLQFDLSGHINHHKTNITIKTKNALSTLTANGEYKDSIWKETISQFDMQSKQYRDWHLKNGVPIEFSSNHLSINPFCWQTQGADFCGQANWELNKQSLIQLDANNIPSTMFNALFPNDTNIQFKLNMQAHFQGDEKNHLQGNMNISTDGGEIKYLAADIKPIHFGKSFIKVIFDKAGLNAQLKINNTTRTPVNITYKLPDYYGNTLPKATQKIEGKIHIHFLRLVLIPTLIPHITSTDGQFRADLSIGGTLYKPTVTGKAAIENGQLTSDLLDTGLNHINITANSVEKGALEINGEAKSDTNTLRISGSSSLRDLSKATLKVTGSNILTINTDEYHIFTSPDLTLTYTKPKLMITGSLLIPKAIISPTTFNTIVTLPSNVIIETGEKQTELSPFLNVYSDVKLTLGNEVGLEYTGLAAKIAGEIEIKNAPNELTTAVGLLRVTKGFYYTHGKRLNIERGNFTFTGGPIDNPGIDVRASKKAVRTGGESVSSRSGAQQGFSPVLSARDITVGVQLIGRLQDPKISLFSEPAGLSDSDILSYLVLGSSAGAASGDAVSLLFEAANFLGPQKFTVLDDIKQKHGLAELGLSRETTKNGKTDDESSFTVGKRVSPKVQMDYGVSLLSPLNILNVKYNLSNRFTVRTEASTRDTSVDVLYSYETN